MENYNLTANKKIIDHFEHPRHIGEIENPDGYAIVGDPACGDHIKIWIRVEHDTIIDFKYKVFGCWGAIVTTSVVSELAIGKSLADASKLTDDEVVQALDGIPENKRHCSILGIQGLRAAIADFLIKDNHKKYAERMEHYRLMGYDIPKERDEIVRLISDLPQDISILDVGTGKGNLALAIARSGRRCISVDCSAEELYYARLNAFHYRLDEQIDFQQQDAGQLSFAKDFFDVVMTVDFIHHLKNPQPVLQEMMRVCKPSGRIIIADLNKNGQQIIAHKHRLENKEHQILGWSLQEVASWFETNECAVTRAELEFQSMLIVTRR